MQTETYIFEHSGKKYQYVIEVKHNLKNPNLTAVMAFADIVVYIKDGDKVISTYEPHGLQSALSSIIFRELKGGDLTEVEREALQAR